MPLEKRFYETDYFYQKRVKDYEKRFQGMNQTKDQKLALEYLCYYEKGTMEELSKKIHPDLIEQFLLIGCLSS